MSTSFKLFFGDTNIRRIRVDSENPSYYEFTTLLHNLYEGEYHPELFVKWQDEEGDMITVSSQIEWEHLLQSVKDRPIKLYITEGQAPYFKDGPPAEPKRFYQEDQEELKVEPAILQRLQQSVPQCLQHLFKGDRILPYNIPDWLQGIVRIKKVPGVANEVDLDVDIPSLFDAMHKRALQLLDDAKNLPLIQQAKQLLLDMLQIVPKHAVTLYNLSCAESLLGNTIDAVKTLRAAIFDAGYSNFEHMEKDSDLENIRSTPEYQELIESIHQKDKMEEIEKPIEENAPMQEESPIDQGWTQVDPVEEVPKPQEPVTPTLSLGEQKWKEAIEMLRGMGFGQDDAYFGVRCVVLLEKHKGDITLVINELLI